MATSTNYSIFSDGKYVVALMLTSILLLASTLLLVGASMVLIARMLGPPFHARCHTFALMLLSPTTSLHARMLARFDTTSGPLDPVLGCLVASMHAWVLFPASIPSIASMTRLVVWMPARFDSRSLRYLLFVRFDTRLNSFGRSLET
jgi:hypothetical protein